MPVTTIDPSAYSHVATGGSGFLYWVLAISFVGVSVWGIEKYVGGSYAWGLVLLILLSALILDHQSALRGLNEAFSAVRG